MSAAITGSSDHNSSARSAFDAAVRLLEKERFEEAASSLEAGLADHPNDPNLLRLLGVSLSRLGRHEEAEQKLTHAVRLVPGFGSAYEDLAHAQLRQGKLDEAIATLRKAVKHSSNPDRASQRLGELLTLMGRGGDAEAVFEAALADNPDRRAIAEALELANGGQLVEAEKRYREVLRRDPDNVDALRLFGVLCIRNERYDDGVAMFRRAVELAPDFWKAWVNLGAALGEQQKFDQAEEALKKALPIAPASVPILERLGANALKAGLLEESIQWLHQALAQKPDHYPSLLCLGHALKTVGKQAEAIDAYRQCVEAKPDFGEAYWSLANLKTFRFTDQEMGEMKEQLAGLDESEESEEAAIAFSFALGKGCEDRKDYVQAFSHYARGNDRKRLKVSYDPIEFQRQNDRIIEVFSRDYFEQHQDQGHDDDAPILIVGLPRSGSTLLEQILASHSQVEGTAELHYLLRGAMEAGLNRTDGIRYPEVMHELKAHQIAGLGLEYIEKTAPHRTDKPYFTDKMPNNFTGVGFLHTILPNAKVIDARRHPLDSCLGTFKQLFASGQLFSYDLYDLAHYYCEYERLMDHWNQVLPGKVLRVNYEDVVADLDTQARRIAEHCGLPWEDRMLSFHETKRAVKTASSEQVRQPIYSSSVNLWRHYETQLEELIDYLEPVLGRLPTSDQPRSLGAGS
ncbi:MAG: sulfotransferase [Pseudomonadota bacterium]